MSDPTIYTRREFLGKTLLGGALSWTIPAFLQATIQDLHATSDDALLQTPTGKDDPILVVIQLSGGNDGLNTIVPYTNDHYYKARRKLSIAKQACLRLTDDLGLHPSLNGLKELYDDGLLSVLQGVGYPNPNRSHFRSMEIWHTASDPHRYESTGWVGRYFDNACQGAPSSVGISISDQVPQAFHAKLPKGVALARPHEFKFSKGLGPDPLDITGSRHANTTDDSSPSPLDYLERVALDARVASQQVQKILRSSDDGEQYPVSGLARQLASVSRLIRGGMPSRIYYVSQGGYDTHSQQLGQHNRLLSHFSDALRTFVMDLKQQGNLDRVCILCFSEFGRRVKENASGGTDHGAAAPVFLAGGGLKPGLHGDLPSLAPTDLVKGDLKHSVDFRSVYATILEKHLKTDSRPVLRRAFPVVDVFKREEVATT